MGLAVGPDPLDRAALPDLHRLVGGDMPGDVGGSERLGGGDGGHEGDDRQESWELAHLFRLAGDQRPELRIVAKRGQIVVLAHPLDDLRLLLERPP